MVCRQGAIWTGMTCSACWAKLWLEAAQSEVWGVALRAGRAMNPHDMQRVLAHLKRDPVVKAVYDAKSEEIGPNIFRFKAEIGAPLECSAALWDALRADKSAFFAAYMCPVSLEACAADVAVQAVCRVVRFLQWSRALHSNFAILGCHSLKLTCAQSSMASASWRCTCSAWAARSSC